MYICGQSLPAKKQHGDNAQHNPAAAHSARSSTLIHPVATLLSFAARPRGQEHGRDGNAYDPAQHQLGPYTWSRTASVQLIDSAVRKSQLDNIIASASGLSAPVSRPNLTTLNHRIDGCFRPQRTILLHLCTLSVSIERYANPVTRTARQQQARQHHGDSHDRVLSFADWHEIHGLSPEVNVQPNPAHVRHARRQVENLTTAPLRPQNRTCSGRRANKRSAAASDACSGSMTTILTTASTSAAP